MRTVTWFPFSISPRRPGDDWTLPEAAKFLGVSVDVLRDGRRAGTLRAVAVGRMVFVTDAELRRVARDGLVPPPAEASKHTGNTPGTPPGVR